MSNKKSTGHQIKLFHQYLRDSYTWMDDDVKKIARKAWFASIKYNKNES